MKIVLTLVALLTLPVVAAYADTGIIVKVEPYDYATYGYHFHLLQPGEKPTNYNFHCWGCNMDDIHLVEKLAGLHWWIDSTNLHFGKN